MKWAHHVEYRYHRYQQHRYHLHVFRNGSNVQRLSGVGNSNDKFCAGANVTFTSATATNLIEMQSSAQIKFVLPSSLLVEKPGVCDSEILVTDSLPLSSQYRIS